MLDLEIIVIRQLHAAAGRHVAAHATGAIETRTGAPIAKHESVRIVVEGDGAHVVVQIRLATVPHVAHGKHEIGQCRQFYKRIAPVALILTGSEVLQLTT